MGPCSACILTPLVGPPRTKDNGADREGLHTEHLAKRPCTVSPSQRYSPSGSLTSHPPPNGLTHPTANGLAPPTAPGPQHYRLEDMALAHHYRDAYRHTEHREARERHRQTGERAMGAGAEKLTAIFPKCAATSRKPPHLCTISRFPGAFGLHLQLLPGPPWEAGTRMRRVAGVGARGWQGLNWESLPCSGAWGPAGRSNRSPADGSGVGGGVEAPRQCRCRRASAAGGVRWGGR